MIFLSYVSCCCDFVPGDGVNDFNDFNNVCDLAVILSLFYGRHTVGEVMSQNLKTFVKNLIKHRFVTFRMSHVR